MIIMMALNLLVFFTLFAGLNKISSYKIYENYDFMKEDYANCLNVVNEHTKVYTDAINEGKELEFRVYTESEEKRIGLFEKESETALTYAKYLTLEDFKLKDEIDLEVEGDVQRANDVIKNMIEEFDKIVLVEEVKNDEDIVTIERLTLKGSVAETALPLIQETYKLHQDKFLWIKNIWVADSPFKSSIMTYSQFEGLVNKKNIEAGEDTIYNSFMPLLKDKEGKVNGYFILPILIIAISFLSTWLSQYLMTRKNKNKDNKQDKDGKKAPAQGKIMQIIMPLIMGIFAIFYNAVFAIYMLTSQLISTALLPLQNLVVKKLEEKDAKKEAQKNAGTMDYRRKQ